jgi:hypothetical protein
MSGADVKLAEMQMSKYDPSEIVMSIWRALTYVHKLLEEQWEQWNWCRRLCFWLVFLMIFFVSQVIFFYALATR